MMNINNEDLEIIKQLDNGDLYADPLVVEQMFHYSDMLNPYLRVFRDQKGYVLGYLPVGYYYGSKEKGYTLSYIAAMPNSPPVSPTYTPGAEIILRTMDQTYFDGDVVADFSCTEQQPTASLYALPLEQYWQFLSASRRKDFARKLKKARDFTIEAGNLKDVRKAWVWMQQIWEQRGGRFGSTPYDKYLETTLAWLSVLNQSPRANLKIDKYKLGNRVVGVNCCVIHRYGKHYHCDDYLTWYDMEVASGLGIVSAINNFTNPALTGFRYNLSNPGLYGNTQIGHEYKWHLIPKPLRLTQSVMAIYKE